MVASKSERDSARWLGGISKMSDDLTLARWRSSVKDDSVVMSRVSSPSCVLLVWSVVVARHEFVPSRIFIQEHLG